MTKDFLKSLNSIHTDKNLSLEEKYLLTILVKYHNVELGYAFPSYKVLMEECSTNRKAKISKILKSLVEKEYITIKKANGNNNLYVINKHLFLEDKNNKEEKKQNNNSNKVTYIGSNNSSRNGFNNFTGRQRTQEYYDEIERKLLGWE